MEIAPGVQAEEVNKLKEAEELAKLRSKLANQKILAEDTKNARIEIIMAEVYKAIESDSGPIKITQDMIDLGIEQKVRAVIMKADMSRSLRDKLRNSEDSEEFDPLLSIDY